MSVECHFVFRLAAIRKRHVFGCASFNIKQMTPNILLLCCRRDLPLSTIKRLYVSRFISRKLRPVYWNFPLSKNEISFKFSKRKFKSRFFYSSHLWNILSLSPDQTRKYFCEHILFCIYNVPSLSVLGNIVEFRNIFVVETIFPSLPICFKHESHQFPN